MKADSIVLTMLGIVIYAYVGYAIIVWTAILMRKVKMKLWNYRR